MTGADGAVRAFPRVVPELFPHAAPRPRFSTQPEMTHGSPDGDGRAGDDGAVHREQRAALLARASQAIRSAHAATEQAEETLAVVEHARTTTMESHTLRVPEREALQELEAVVRLFAGRLREDGTPPEVAVRRLKATVDPVVFSTRDHDGGDVEWKRTVAGDVIRWFVEAYYTP